MKKWLEEAPGFNTHRVRTPLLQQWHGGSLWSAAEFHNGLFGQGKPVDVIWFPGGFHILQVPSEREASMQQVVDWFRFWLQDFERTAPGPREPREDLTAQYGRWRKLREQHVQNERWIASGKDPAAEFTKQLSTNGQP